VLQENANNVYHQILVLACLVCCPGCS